MGIPAEMPEVLADIIRRHGGEWMEWKDRSRTPWDLWHASVKAEESIHGPYEVYLREMANQEAPEVDIVIPDDVLRVDSSLPCHQEFLTEWLGPQTLPTWRRLEAIAADCVASKVSYVRQQLLDLAKELRSG